MRGLSERRARTVNERRRRVLATAASLALFAGACAKPRAVSPGATAQEAVHSGPLTDFVPAAGLRWLAVARLSELAHDAALGPSLDLLFPRDRLDAFVLSTGLDLRETPSAAAAGFDYATLYLAETPNEGALIETRFSDRLIAGAKVTSHGASVRRISGAVGRTPETLVRVDRRFVAVSVGDPTPARVVELYALGRLGRAPPALRGSALSTLPRDLDSAPIRFYAPGPFSDEWAHGARGLLGAALALGVGGWPEGNQLHVRAVLSGRWRAEDTSALLSAWTDLATSSMGRLLGLDQPAREPNIAFSPDQLALDVKVPIVPLVEGLRAAVVADVWEILRFRPLPDTKEKN